MKGQLFFRIFVDISSYPWVFCFEGFYNLFNFFCCCAFKFHTWVRFSKSLFHKMGLIINTIIIIIYTIIFTLSFNIFCSLNSNFSTTVCWSVIFLPSTFRNCISLLFFFISSRFFIYNAPCGFNCIMGV